MEDIVTELTNIAKEQDDTGKWAATTLDQINLRSPTSLKVTLEAIRRGKNMSLGEVLQMEMELATAFIVRSHQLLCRVVTNAYVERRKRGFLHRNYITIFGQN